MPKTELLMNKYGNLINATRSERTKKTNKKALENYKQLNASFVENIIILPEISRELIEN